MKPRRKARSEKTLEVEPRRSNFHLRSKKLDPPQPRRTRAAPLPLCKSQHTMWTSEVNRSLCGSVVTTPNEERVIRVCQDKLTAVVIFAGATFGSDGGRKDQLCSKGEGRAPSSRMGAPTFTFL